MRTSGIGREEKEIEKLLSVMKQVGVIVLQKKRQTRERTEARAGKGEVGSCYSGKGDWTAKNGGGQNSKRSF